MLGRGERRIVTVVDQYIRRATQKGKGRHTFRELKLACGFQRARGVFGEVVEDDGGGHGHGEGGVGVWLWFWWC